MCQQMTARLPCSVSSVPLARSLVNQEMDAWGDHPDEGAQERADLLLAVSELVANAVRFGRRDLGLLLVAHRDSVKLVVTDDCPRPARLCYPDPLTPGGRGLALVDAVTEQWGQRRYGGFKAVWAKWTVLPSSGLGGNCTHPLA